MSTDRGSGLAPWWAELGAVALVGTARRPVPPAPGGLEWPVAAREGVPPEEALLDAVAVGGALRRAGALPRTGPVAEPGADDVCPPDERPLAPARARQLLDLLLDQPPVGARLAPQTLLVWLTQAERHGVRVHHASLVPLLARATEHRSLRAAVRPVLDHRGRWLAAAHPAWGWAVDPTGDPTTGPRVEPVDPATWARLPTDLRAVQVRALRATDPAGARALVESTWATDPAPARAVLLAGLEVGIRADDEPLLERALDDRAAGVRDVARSLLDALPGSARAERLAALLRPLVSTTGRVRREAHVELPTAPDAAAQRDGLAGAPRGRSERGWWLERLAAGAPLEVWTDATGLDAGAVARSLSDADALAGLRRATVLRRDATWARALLQRGWDAGLARCLPPGEVVTRMTDRLREVSSLPDLLDTLRLSPGPWDERTSVAVVERVALLPRVPHVVPDLVDVLAAGLDPALAPAVSRLAHDGGHDGGQRDGQRDGGRVDRSDGPLRDLAQHLSLVPTITEAFT